MARLGAVTTTIGALVAAAALVSSAVAAAGAVELTRAKARGNQATATASGVARRPDQVIVRVMATPRQRVIVRWRLACATLRADETRRGQFAAVTPVNRALPLPIRKPHACTVSASAKLTSRGAVTLILLKNP